MITISHVAIDWTGIAVVAFNDYYHGFFGHYLDAQLFVITEKRKIPVFINNNEKAYSVSRIYKNLQEIKGQMNITISVINRFGSALVAFNNQDRGFFDYYLDAQLFVLTEKLERPILVQRNLAIYRIPNTSNLSNIML